MGVTVVGRYARHRQTSPYGLLHWIVCGFPYRDARQTAAQEPDHSDDV